MRLLAYTWQRRLQKSPPRFTVAGRSGAWHCLQSLGGVSMGALNPARLCLSKTGARGIAQGMFLILLALVVGANTCLMATRSAARYVLGAFKAARWLVADFLPRRL